jgi:hypothetical protein
MRTLALGQLVHVAAAVNPFEYGELAVLATATRTAFPLGDLPLLVITRGLQDEEGPQAERLEDDHQEDQRSLVALSRRGEQLIASRSGHHVQLDEPALIVSAVQGFLCSVRN